MSDNKKPREGYYSALSGARRAVPIILFAVALFVTVCFITNSVGAFGQAVSSFLRGLFSFGAYAIPVALVLHAVFYAEDYAKGRILSRAIFSTITVSLISIVEYAIVFWGKEYPFNPLEFYNEAYAGGLIGSTIAFGLVQFLGSLGVIILALAIVAVYITFFFSNPRSAFSRVMLGVLSAIVGALAAVEKWIKSIFKKHNAKKNKKREAASAKKNKDFIDDPFFTADGSLNEIKIDELGIHKRIDVSNDPPALQTSVFHKSQVTEPEKPIDTVKINEASTEAPRITHTKSSAPDFSYGNTTSIPKSAEAEPTVEAQPKVESEHKNVQPDTSAESIFTKDFDPFDFMRSEMEASRPSSKYVPKTEAPKEKPIATISYEDAERERREKEFARRKEMLLKKQEEEAAKAIQAEPTPEVKAEAEPKSEPIPEAAVKSEPMPEVVTEAEQKPEPTSEVITESAPEPEQKPEAKSEPIPLPKAEVVTATKSDSSSVKTVEFKVDNSRKEEPSMPRPSGGFYTTYEKPERDPEGSIEETPYADYILKKVADANPAYTASYNETRTYVSVTETTEEPAVPQNDEVESPVFKPFSAASDAVKIVEPEQKNDGDEGLKIDRVPITVDISEQKEEKAEVVPETSPLLEDTEDDSTPDTSLIDFEDEDEVEEEEITTPPEEDDGDMDEIPPEKQNPEVIRQREMFPFLDDAPSEEPIIAAEPEPVDEPAIEHPISEEPVPDMPKAEQKPSLSLVSVDEPKKEEKKKPDYSDYVFPPIDLLGLDENADMGDVQAEYQENADKLVETLASFNITASIKGVDRGPRITRYEVVPSRGIKVSSVMSLENDIAMGLAADGIRMEAPIPGKSAIGIEIPNKKPVNVRLRELIETEDFKTTKSKTAVCIGKDVAGQPVINDISKMPHLLIAGATGMGKSVCINSLMISILYKAKPNEVKFIMIDPKQVEFTMYNGIPHLLVPVVSDAKKAAGALMWAVEEMERRYNLLNTLCVRNIDAYNEKVENSPSLGEPMSKIVIVIDEFADLMLQVKDPVENLVMRIAQKARAAGIHLIIGTQRPAVNVITGTIKANVPSRISCKVASNVDSRTVLDAAGAEKLLNRGDMLFAYSGAIKPLRVQGAFVTDSEVENITNHLKKFATGNDYDTSVMEEIERAAQRCNKKGGGGDDDDSRSDGSGEGYLNDKQFLDAVEVAVNTGKISTSLIQRKISVGYGKAAKFIDIMEEMGIVGESNGQKPRDVLITPDEWREKLARTMLD